MESAGFFHGSFACDWGGYAPVFAGAWSQGKLAEPPPQKTSKNRRMGEVAHIELGYAI